MTCPRYHGCVISAINRYMGLKIERVGEKGDLESKGMETVRRDTCLVRLEGCALAETGLAEDAKGHLPSATALCHCPLRRV